MAKLSVWIAIASSLAVAHVAPHWQGDAASISNEIGKLRSMPDDARARETKSLAVQILNLPAGHEKINLASSLANLATEGDFGRDTLQAVTDALATSLRETPGTVGNEGDAQPYFQLAQLEKFEEMKVALVGPLYVLAKSKLAQIEAARAAANFKLVDIQGKTWTLSALRGKVVLVNFWATWCPPCRKEMPDIETLSQRFKSQGLVVLAISDEDLKTVQPFIVNHKVTFPVLLDPGRVINERYKVDGIPKSFIYDRRGKLVAESIDMRTQAQFLRLLAKAGLK